MRRPLLHKPLGVHLKDRSDSPSHHKRFHPDKSRSVKDTAVSVLNIICLSLGLGARCSSVVRAFAHGVMGRRIDPSWGGPIELFLAPRLV